MLLVILQRFWLGDGFSGLYYSQDKIRKLNKKNENHGSVWTDDSLA